jgi:triacylglycerol esterase/lipase EstA (alpha/beta hydrolase family)
MHDEDTHTRREPATEAEPKAVIERYEDRPNQCTIFVPGESEVETMSTWITADEDSFCHLETVR